eukprot:COSAG02_NODE_41826_length_390_cov_1.213058_1_plen_21_part_01
MISQQIENNGNFSTDTREKAA